MARGRRSKKGTAAKGGSSPPSMSQEMATTAPMDSVDDGQKRSSQKASNESSPLVPPTEVTRKGHVAKGISLPMGQVAKGGSSPPSMSQKMATTASTAVDKSGQKIMPEKWHR